MIKVTYRHKTDNFGAMIIVGNQLFHNNNHKQWNTNTYQINIKTVVSVLLSTTSKINYNIKARNYLYKKTAILYSI